MAIHLENLISAMEAEAPASAQSVKASLTKWPLCEQAIAVVTSWRELNPLLKIP